MPPIRAADQLAPMRVSPLPVATVPLRVIKGVLGPARAELPLAAHSAQEVPGGSISPATPALITFRITGRVVVTASLSNRR